MEWKDITSYSRNDEERRPTTWELKQGRLRIVVTCSHVEYRGKWVLRCANLGLDLYPLPIDPASPDQVAKKYALDLVRNEVKRMLYALEKNQTLNDQS
jgi:hypothetical protein